jgi:hypothetical protein
MKNNDLEPGGVYENARGQRREIVEIDRGWVVYRMLDRGTGPHFGVPVMVGETRTLQTGNFAQWALREVA